MSSFVVVVDEAGNVDCTLSLETSSITLFSTNPFLPPIADIGLSGSLTWLSTRCSSFSSFCFASCISSSTFGCFKASRVTRRELGYRNYYNHNVHVCMMCITFTMYMHVLYM